MKTGTIVATAVATMMLSGGVAQAKGKKAAKTDKAAAAASVHCFGLNTCAGQGSCKSDNNACAKKNSCSGAGWTAMADEKACKDKGGRLTAQADAKPADKPVEAKPAAATPNAK